MKPIFITMIFCLMLNFLYGQAVTDTIKKTYKIDERDLVFTRAEHMPGYKFGMPALADSIKKYLLQTTSEFSPGKMLIILLINRAGNVTINKIPNIDDNAQADQIKRALLATSGMWIPANQNGYLVSCYEKLILDFSTHDLRIEDN